LRRNSRSILQTRAGRHKDEERSGVTASQMNVREKQEHAAERAPIKPFKNVTLAMIVKTFEM
jgi:hypothetical protein